LSTASTSPNRSADDPALALAAAAAEAVLGGAGWRARELPSSRTLRSFLVSRSGAASRLLRFGLEPESVGHEIKTLAEVEEVEVGLALEHHDASTASFPWPFAIYRGRGRLGRLTALKHPPDPEDVALLLARLHDLPSLMLMRSFPFQEKPSILAVFQRIVEYQRNYLLYREQDGLPQDMLALTLADIGRVMRRYVVAQEHYFLPHPRRSLCHGGPAPACLVRDRGALRFFGFEQARVGDAARDLALFAIATGLDEEAEASFLEAYVAASTREDHRLIHRYFAHKVVAQFERPVERLLGLYRIKYEGAPVFGGMIDVLIDEVEAATRELAVALSSLNDFLGRGRPLAPRDVASMGRLVTYEEYLLREQSLTIAIDGAAYSGKTPVATELAARLNANYLNIGALLRTGVSLAGSDPADLRVSDVAQALRGHEVVLETTSDAPHYSVLVDDEEITDLIRTPPLYAAQARLLSDPVAREQLAPLIVPFLRGTTVVEGEHLDDLLPATARRFTLVCDEAVRERRQQEHADAIEGEVPPLRPAPAPTVEAIDATREAPTQTALEISQRCLPAAVR